VVERVVPICNPSYSRSGGRRIENLGQAQAKLGRLNLKNKIQKRGRAGGIPQVEKHLPSIY
jgi:hypothetical protein